MARGGVKGVQPLPPKPAREIFLLQRKDSKPGKNLGKTTGWIHRMNLKRRNVKALSGVSYEKIDDHGLHIEHGGEQKCLEVDNVIICAGQQPNRDLATELEAAGIKPRLIGGAHVARELDAKHAIREGSELAATI